MGYGLIEQRESRSAPYAWRKSKYSRWLKKAKARAERRRAKRNPESVPGYGRYSGWEF